MLDSMGKLQSCISFYIIPNIPNHYSNQVTTPNNNVLNNPLFQIHRKVNPSEIAN